MNIFKKLIPFALLMLLFCTPDDWEEMLTGCEIEEGNSACFSLKQSCKGEYSEWHDPEALSEIKCKCCESDDERDSI
jgi:hypothetical protein